MTSRRKWWLIFGAGTLGVLAAMLWISTVVLRLEAQTQHQQWMRLALWRMDSWLGGQLREESNRPYFEYLPFYPQERAYTRILNEIEPGEVYSPSPLLTFQSKIFALHFQLSDTGELTSPQAPRGNWRDLAEAVYVDGQALADREALLGQVSSLVQREMFVACVEQAEAALAQFVDVESTATPAQPQQSIVLNSQEQIAFLPESQSKAQKAISKRDFQQRFNANIASQQQQEWIENPNATYAKQSARNETVSVGALAPLWLSGQRVEKSQPQQSHLLFVRRVNIGSRELHQGVLVDWAELRAALLGQIADLFPQANLAPVHEPSDADVESGRLLGSVPVSLECTCPLLAAGPALTPARTTLGITWLAVLLAVAAAAVTLRASIHYGEKRSRFASAVTHELRTPLTTFRMYSEMLAEGMVNDDEQRRSYLQTLKSESNRLATLVENVLSYARLEDGRAVSNARRTTVAELTARVKGLLTRRAAEAKMQLQLNEAAPPSAATNVDADVVGQILFNLVDNACKYANGASDRTIQINTAVDDDRLRIEVRDQGPGIAPEHARRIFAPFDRGAHGPGDTIPGVGLGLALARGLARDLGGDLTLGSNPNGQSKLNDASRDGHCGACFILTLPLAKPA